MSITNAYEPVLLCVGVIFSPLPMVYDAVQSRLEPIENRPFCLNVGTIDWTKFFKSDGQFYDVLNAEIVLFSPRENLTVYTCNLADGWISLYGNIVKDCAFDAYFFRATLAPRAKYEVFEMIKWSRGILGRQVRTLQDDDGWTFINKGEPLPFESLENYKRRLIRLRLDREIIQTYSEMAGYKINDVTQFNDECWRFHRSI